MSSFNWLIAQYISRRGSLLISSPPLNHSLKYPPLKATLYPKKIGELVTEQAKIKEKNIPKPKTEEERRRKDAFKHILRDC